MLVSPNVHLAELPLPFSLDAVNVFFVKLNEGYLLIDCGMDSPACFAAIDQARAEIGIEWPSIRRILLTHAHPDHMGLAPRLLALTDARLSMHPGEARLLEEFVLTQENRERIDGQLARAGTPRDLIAKVDRAFGPVSKSFRILHPDAPLEGGETIRTADGELEAIWTPGHSPGHLCFYDRARRILFSGDHILEFISPNIGWQPGRDFLGDYIRSLNQMLGLEIDLILPAHGGPFRGHRQWIANTLRHHEERCSRIRELLRDGAKTAHELAGELWTRSLTPFHYRFAIFEVLAHLEYLRGRGDLIARGDDVAVWESA